MVWIFYQAWQTYYLFELIPNIPLHIFEKDKYDHKKFRRKHCGASAGKMYQFK